MCCRQRLTSAQGRGDLSSTSPATPLGMRVRTGRFDGLRSAGRFRDSQPFEEIVRQCHVERHRRVVPPASAVGGDPSGCIGRHPASDQLAMDDPTALPVFELHRPGFAYISRRPWTGSWARSLLFSVVLADVWAVEDILSASISLHEPYDDSGKREVQSCF
jgi:hypothetical protein